jgi:carboxyl-terminal processing protease
MKKTILFIIILFTVSEIIAEEKNNHEEIFPLLDLFASSVAIIESDYVDEIDPTNLFYGALHGMLRSLDPHSEFMEPEAVDNLKTETEGEFGGIGIEIGIRDDFPTVIAPIEDTPAFEKGLMPNDKIIKVEDKNTRGMPLSKVIKMLKGEPGTKVNFTILRTYSDKRETKEINIERAIIKIKKIKNVKIVDVTNGVGYIRLTGFDKTAGEGVKNAIDSLVTQDMKSLVLDIRNNGGGLLKSAVEVAELFLETNQIIVSTRGRIFSQNRTYRSKENNNHYTFPLVVLVNGASASAAEIVCGAIKDHHRGIVLGSKTYGKGSVQTVLPVGGEDTGLKLTTAKYYTPSGTCIHGTGIFPNVEIKISFEDEIKLIQKRSRKYSTEELETLTEEEQKLHKKLKKFRDIQLDRAIDLLKALQVFSASDYKYLFKPGTTVTPHITEDKNNE